ncbi:electron transfer flavoprotein subunit beta/FixA family protein [Aurantimonas sp. C2-6-R+9]|uniref:electron transfer flavoprotein subunit beta/FixA family protein n=1 Tax=unclassified Aurantimonas TaxID=2638230 RepID=UPI002E187428|nr:MULTISPECIES: electron transfer flavoprotein subunit beta/FixA family protein [unclassified Aurantimonas]MEC5292374.1 electron transfer flavoprotein subunit beta/FixA family protein [Aurantimonas sp. C2-3-R2]MEC5322221.1 electron transfer flavoprotein subunit beta/FixA family protein [Aurantimonas sp. A3-2-R12]MEC5382527.1 electron transfer flavoprotein subunit beta/FixA family protein [Aurantimonas sp. C2-6-R+9]MEC5411841.1 electron transfer flavoprotein subunit beta/FixA family protein [Au
MKILVPVKQVAILDDEFEMRDDGRDVDEDFFEKDLNEFDHFAVEEALLIKEAAGEGGEVVVVTVGDADADDALRTALAKGAERGIRVWDDGLADADGIAIAKVLAKVVEREAPDMVFTGAQSSDFGHATTGIALAGLLGWPHAAVVSKLDYAPGAASATVHRELEGGLEEIMTVTCPAVLSIQLGINQPRYASLRGIRQAKQKPVDELGLGDLGLGAGDIAPASRVRRMYAPEKGQAEIITGSAAEQAARLAEIIKEQRGM